MALIVLGCTMVFPALSYAQESQPEASSEGGTKFIDRISIRTNVVDWLITVPNISFGFDLLPGPYNNQSVLWGLKWNWNTYHKMPSYYVFNVFDTRAEYRYHFRFTERQKGEKPNFFSLKRAHPRPWLAHYLGAYADFSTFSIKPGSMGRQGWQAGAGISYGIEMPLYQYKTGAIDLELGASAGVTVATYNYYELTEGNTSYQLTGEAFMVLPMITELRAVLSWRKHSVKDKYQVSDPEIPRFRGALGDMRSSMAKTTKKAFDEAALKAERKRYAESDSLYRAAFVAWVEGDMASEKAKLEFANITPEHQKQIADEIDRLGKQAIRDFDAELRKKHQAEKKEQNAKAAEAKKAEKAKQAEEKKAEAEVKKAAKEAEKAAAKEAKEAKAQEAKEAKAQEGKETKEAKAKENKKEKVQKEKVQKEKKEKK